MVFFFILAQTQLNKSIPLNKKFFFLKKLSPIFYYEYIELYIYSFLHFFIHIFTTK